jgi:hypothetical protein
MPRGAEQVREQLRGYGLPDPDPDTDTWPRITTAAHPRAVGSYGRSLVECSLARGVSLRWWQRFVAYRALEHDDDGRLVWESVLLTTTRQVGKSWLLRELALWRLQVAPDLFDNPTELVMYVSDRIDGGREVWLPAAAWAEGRGWPVRRANGEQELTTPGGARWLVRSARSGGYGYTIPNPIVDEAWNVQPATIDDALAPTMIECDSPQMIVTSTAHPRATSTVPTMRRAALEQQHDPVRSLLLEWSADPARSSDDESGWREASPSWSSRRREFVAERWAKTRSEDSFRAQWLNIWPSLSRAQLVDDEAWLALTTVGLRPPPSMPLVVGVETSRDGRSYSAVAVWPDERGFAIASTTHGKWLPVAERAREWCAAPGSRLLASVGVRSRIDAQQWPCEVVPTGTRELRGAVAVLQSLAAEGRLTHDGSPVLARQVANALVTDTDYGPHVSTERSPGPVDAVKAMLWAVHSSATTQVAVGQIA